MSNQVYDKIREIRSQRVILDFDLAELYCVETKALNQAVKRNMNRFPGDFMFKLTQQEWLSQRSQFVTFEIGRAKYSKYVPHAFTEQGVAMLSGLLNSAVAVTINIAIMRAFVQLRSYLLNYGDISLQIEELKSLTG